MSAGATPRRLGVLGAGTMGSGIAEVGARAGLPTVLCDPVAGAAQRGLGLLRGSLSRAVDRGRIASADADAALERVAPASRIEDLLECDLVIEAAPEDLALKRSAFATLDAGCAPDAILATNTSSIPVTSIAAACARPERVIGLHFFNPVPVMRLLEVVPAEQTAPATTVAALEIARLLGKQAVVAADLPGFLVNRCGRPYYAESLQVVTERVATPAQVDRICRLGAGFRMGPFELMDLVGTDVALDVMRSFAERSSGEPRWRPSPLHARLVAAGRLGRKSGHGWHPYDAGAGPEPAPRPPRPSVAGLRLRVVGRGPVGARLRAAAEEAGAALVDDPEAVAFLVDDAAGADAPLAAVRVRSCAAASLVGLGDPGAVGLGLAPGPLAEVAATGATDPAAVALASRLLVGLGFHVEEVRDGPGLVLDRILAQVVNEACFAVGEGVGSAEDVDRGATLGLNYPRGPIAWGSDLGFPRVRATLDGLWRERRQERYRPAPALVEAALTGALRVG